MIDPVRTLADVLVLVRASIIAVDTELDRANSLGFIATLGFLSTRLHDAHACLNLIMEQDLEGRKWE